MKRTNRFLLFVVLIVISISCTTREDKVKHFVESFNSNVSTLQGGSLKKMSAKYIDHNKVEIDVFTNDKNGIHTEQIYDNTFAKYFEEKVYSYKYVDELINDSLKFELFVYDKDDNLIIKRIYDNSNMGLHKSKDLKVLMNKKSSEARKLASTLNMKLPVEDKANGIIALKFDMISDTSIEYIYEVSDEDVNQIKQQSAVIKNSFLHSKSQVQPIKKFFSLGVKDFYFVFTNKEKTNRTSILVREKDLKN